MLGDADATSVREVIPEGVTEEQMQRMSIHRKKPWQKLIVAAGGPVFNFIFAIVVLIALALIKGVPTYINTINPIAETSVAYLSGLRNGDRILKANEQPIKVFEDLKGCIQQSSGANLQLEVEHKDGQKEEITIKMTDANGAPITTLGIMPGEVAYRPTTVVGAITISLVTVYVIASENIKAIFQIAVQKRSSKEVGGVISIFKAATDSAEAGVYNFIWMLATLSIILGAVNLLPIPVLDGGTIMISAIEWVIGRPLGEKVINVIFFIGLVVVVALMSLGLWNDLEKIKVISWIKNLFH